MIEMCAYDLCTGCGACEAICPVGALKLQFNNEGFKYPVVDDKCIECNKCSRICPIDNLIDMGCQNTEAYAGIFNNNEIRLQSSSGGIFSALAFEVFKQGGLVYGASFNEKHEIEHKCAENMEELSALRGAKYAQSELGDSYLKIFKQLKNGKIVLFSGTPCQVAGLKAYLNEAYENLITLDFVCHGVPSPLVWQNYIQYRAIKDNSGKLPISINLRSKHSGWSKYSYTSRYQYSADRIYEAVSGEEAFIRLFNGNYINRRSCSNCRFKGYNRLSDLTLGDFWGIWDIYPEMDDNKGTSLIMVHSKMGRELLKKIESTCTIKAVTLDQASLQNAALLYSFPMNIHRDRVIQLALHNRIDEALAILEEKNAPKKVDHVFFKLERIIKKYLKLE